MDKKTFKPNGIFIAKIVTAIFCIVTGTCAAYIMFNVYSPNKNALGALSSVCMDVLCMLIIIILIISFAFDDYKSKQTTKLFAVLLVATLWALFTDFMNWAFDGELEFYKITYWFTVGSLCMGSILACIFSQYLYSYMAETHNLTKMHGSARVCAILNIISFVITFVLALTGTAFEFVDGHYEIGALYDIVTVIPIVTLLYLTCYVIRYVKIVGKHDALAAAGYICFMIGGALIEATYGIGTTYVSVTIADIFIFVMLQNEVIAMEKRNVQEWMQKSNTDELTGVFNRFAYENDLAELEKAGSLPNDFVYLSVDVNALKSANDTLGHNAGDELLIGAAHCLKKSIGSYGKVYRTGGDEFIAIFSADSEQLGKIQKDIEESTRKWHGKLVRELTLSCGYVTREEGRTMSIRQIAVLADRKMYRAKDEYYKSNGIERRKK